MRREQRNRKQRTNSNTLIYISGGILAAAIIAFIITFVVYSNRLNSNSSGVLDIQYLSEKNVEDKNENATAVSSKIGKSIEESKENEYEEEKKDVGNNSENNSINTTKTSLDDNTITNPNKKSNKKEKDLRFVNPIEKGELTKEFAKDNLIYSETLKEWITHLGIDIKAERASAVKCACEGVVRSIKNDPRYGLTIIIEHSNGYKTLYANLLTTEFVSEGEKVKAGQTIGTVGDTGVYEIVDEPHLHFEIIKNGENLNPSELIKF